MSLTALPLALTLGQTVGWVAFILVLVIGLLIVGRRDVLRFSLRRVWAISGVCFDESIRRRVLWIIPLAALGVIVVSQLQKPFDEQDAIRQTTKFALFATGLVVVVTTIILAATNLPREIESRVIYTVVTKPTTRLEIVTGKVIGFARVSLTILLIMGVFAYAYLALRAWNMRRQIADRLESGTVPALSRPTLEHYRDNGLLTAKALESPERLEVFAQPPTGGEIGSFWGDGEQEMLVAFDLPQGLMASVASEGTQPGPGFLIAAKGIGYETDTARRRAGDAAGATTGPSDVPPYMGPYIVPPEQRQTAVATEPARLMIQFFDADLNPLMIDPSGINAGRPIRVEDPTGSTEVVVPISPQVAQTLSNHSRVFVGILGSPEKTRFVVRDSNPVEIRLPNSEQPGTLHVLDPVAADDASAAGQATTPPPALVLFRGRVGNFGQQLRGGNIPEANPVAVYQFRDAEVDDVGEDGRIPFEFRVGIERTGDDPTEEDRATHLAITVTNRQTGQTSPVVHLSPEASRPAFFSVPADAVAGGDFDVTIANRTLGHYVGLTTTSLNLVAERQSFAWNLSKSLLILWLMAVLVTAVAIFCSTFLSWPIAIVLTLVILLGHWGVQQLGDATQPGIGNTVATDLFGASAANAARARAVSASVEALSKFLNAFSSILPDISQYSATEDIERGMTITGRRLLDAAAVTFGFGIPLTVLAYVFLKNKEVAP